MSCPADKQLPLPIQPGPSTNDLSVDSFPTQDLTRPFAEPIDESEFDIEKATGGRYVFIRVIATGGTGRILLARDTKLSRHVAVKVLRRGVRDNARAAMRFTREARLTASLNHPGVVPVHDMETTSDGCSYFIMQEVVGKTLRDLINEANAADEDQTDKVSHLVALLQHVCQTAGYAHHEGIVHRDLKPDNIMVGPFGEVLVMDWGIAKEVGKPSDTAYEELSPANEPGDTHETQFGKIHGTPGYMSPEQTKGDMSCVGAASDVFSLGIILYEILAGERPFTGDKPGDLIDAVRNGRRLSVRVAARRNRDSAPSKAVEAICEKALKHEPSERYANALDMAEDIEAYFENRPVFAHDEGVISRALRWLRRHRTFRGVLLTTAAAACFGIAFAATQRFSLQHTLAQFQRQVAERREDYRNVVTSVLWLQRQLEREASADTPNAKRLEEDLRREQSRRLLAIEHLSSALGATMAAQRGAVDVDMCREYRRLWLEEMQVAASEGWGSYVCERFERMLHERDQMPWWKWEPEEFRELDELQQWVRDYRSRHPGEGASALTPSP